MDWDWNWEAEDSAHGLARRVERVQLVERGVGNERAHLLPAPELGTAVALWGDRVGARWSVGRWSVGRWSGGCRLRQQRRSGRKGRAWSSASIPLERSLLQTRERVHEAEQRALRLVAQLTRQLALALRLLWGTVNDILICVYSYCTVE